MPTNKSFLPLQLKLFVLMLFAVICCGQNMQNCKTIVCGHFVPTFITMSATKRVYYRTTHEQIYRKSIILIGSCGTSPHFPSRDKVDDSKFNGNYMAVGRRDTCFGSEHFPEALFVQQVKFIYDKLLITPQVVVQFN